MTVTQLIEQALAELDHPASTAALPLWKDKLLRFANEAVTDLTETFRPWRRDPLTLTNETLQLSALPYAVGKVLGVERNGMRIPFHYGAGTGELKLPGVADGAVTVVYRYLPKTLVQNSDEPELPACSHPLIVQYMVARFEMNNDAAAQNRAGLLLSNYELRKRRLKMDLDEPSGCALFNCF